MRWTSLSFAGVFIVAFVLAPAAHAQPGPFHRATASVAGPPESLAAPDDAYAVEVNPAAIALLRAWGLLYVHSDAQADDPFVQRGDALYFGAPLPFGLALGGQLASERPTTASGASDRGIGQIAFALSPNPMVSMGTAVRFIRSADFASRHVGWDMSMDVRPSPYLAMALMGYDLNALVDLTPAGVDVDSTFVLALAARPLGTDVLTLEAAGGVDTAGRLGVRGFVSFPVPHVGALRGAIEADDLTSNNVDLRVTAGLDVRWGGLSVGGGPLWADAFDHSPGWYVSAGLSGVRRPGLPERHYVLSIDQDGKLDSRGILELERKLDGALHDRRVVGVLLRLRSTDVGMSYAQELRGLLTRLKDAGKPVVCQLEMATGSEYYACAAASRTLIDPAGSVRLMGPSTELLLIGKLLHNLGIHADFVRIGKYKSAPEQLENEKPSAPSVEQEKALVDDAWQRLTADLASDLKVSQKQAEKVVDDGPYAAPEALAAHIVAGEGDDLDLHALVQQGFGTGFPLKSASPHRAPGTWGQPPHVGVIVVDGMMVDGDNVDVPILGVHLSGSKTVIKALQRMSADPSVKAIVLRVDSPGGSALAADKIWRAVREARKHKPVIASLGAVAASGGYYIASAASEIWADPSTITGSIGIFYGKVDVSQLADRIGVYAQQISRGKHAGADSIWHPYTDEEREALKKKIAIWYHLFLERVAAGRHMTVDQVDAVARGRVWSGDAAIREGLADKLGGFGTVLARAREMAGLRADAGFTVAPFRPSNLLEYVVGHKVGGKALDVPRIGARLQSSLGLIATLGQADDGMPFALAPYAIAPPR